MNQWTGVIREHCVGQHLCGGNQNSEQGMQYWSSTNLEVFVRYALVYLFLAFQFHLDR